ncbi:hypothetical protein [Capnocytophaga catalasegens]|uniref:Uncharacterized protein n=1 Tax=Capnocytophaga catalasegens TaxID=1004260 RepID=A0AAV5AX21_9FLAO|nr:hypothetical protein [Capnocytophaga catalasegens]GIZ15959.1 hypothetical protein RCZ03_19590 [Capnocytophaga catalasegens]GJM50446.1 hypothetical protein RCZ15_14190 [Capnocytophaga catalasegens]GJM53941.1 hypothetical protein RCZ16_22570 [Capnocytophaga catalasegens]
MKPIVFIISCLCTYLVQAQINPNSLFIVFDDKEGILKIEKNDVNDKYGNLYNTTYYYKYHQKIEEFNRDTQKWYKTLTYRHQDIKAGWWVSLHHSHRTGGKYNNYILHLPKELFDSFKEARNKVKTISEMEKIWKTLDSNNYSFFFEGYKYYFQLPIAQKGYYRDNVFMVFTSDLEKEFIPCYEVNVYYNEEADE